MLLVRYYWFEAACVIIYSLFRPFSLGEKYNKNNEMLQSFTTNVSHSL